MVELTELAASWEHKIKVYRKTKDNSLFEEAKSLRNQLKTDITTAKTDYFKNLLEINYGDAKKFWDVVKEIANVKGAAKTVSRVINPDTGQLADHSQTPNLINTFFTGIGPKLASLIPTALDPLTLHNTDITSDDIEPIEPDWIATYLT